MKIHERTLRVGVGIGRFTLGLLCWGSVAVWAAPPSDAGRVELLRDRWGTPHVFATTDEGALYGLGFATAEDRLYQMHFNLRLMQGRLAEVVGDLRKRRQKSFGQNSAVEEDRLMRTLGFARHAQRVVERLDPETRRLLEAYCAGVNDGVARRGDNLPALFAAQGWRPEPWTPADCLLSWWQMARFFSSDGLRDLWSLKQRNNPQRARFRSRSRRVVDDDAAVVRREDVSDAWVARTEAFMRAHGLLPDLPTPEEAPGPKFSHAWVLGGQRTTTGAAVLVSDPQTPVWNPSLFYEFHLVGRSFNARGIGVAGSPLILIGFTEHVAWGLTALGADQADLFLLKTDPAHPDAYRLDGEWRPMEKRVEQIRVAGGEPVELTVRETVFGPVVSEFALGRRDEEVALKRVPLCEPDRDTVQACLAMLRARSAPEFLKSLGDWRFPSGNCVFGDRAGAIGYSTVGAIPVRSAGDREPGLAHDGGSLKNDWQTFVPPDLVPQVLNPKRGYLVSANHRSIQSFYQLTLGVSTGAAGDTDRGWRIKQRIQQALAKGGKVSPADVLAMQSDKVNAVKQAILRVGYHLRDQQPAALSAETKRALDYLEDWYAAGAASDTMAPGTELANAMQILFRETVVPLAATYGGGGSGLVLAMKTFLRRLDRDPKARFTDEEVTFIDGVLAAAWQRCAQQYGTDTKRWPELARRAGEGTRLGYFESLSGYPSLAQQWDLQRPLLQVLDGSTILAQPGQSYTQFVPMDDPDAALSVLPPGVSEEPASPRRFSNLAAWAGGALHPAPLSREAVEKITVQHAWLAGAPPSVRSAREAAGRGQSGRDAPPSRRPASRPRRSR